MRRIVSLIVVSLLCGVALSSAQSAPRASEERLIGAWAGTFDGDGTGKYTMTIARDADKKLGGTLEAMPDGGDGYSATFKSIVVDGAKATLKYDTPGGEAAEVVLDATLDGTTLKGTWKVVDPTSKAVAQSGSFTGSKK